jgi:hypothetical protein
MADQAGLLSFVRNTMGISSVVLPDNSLYLTQAYGLAQDMVDPLIQSISAQFYDLAFYNWCGDWLLGNATDQSGQTFFADQRVAFGLNSFAAGVVQSASDESTSDSLAVPETLKNLQIDQLQQLKTPYGRAYLAIAQKTGPLWGLS